MLSGAVLPHAPLLLTEPAAPEVSSARRALGRAAASLARALPADATVVVLSPHGSQACVYAGAQGDLGGFGLSVGWRGRVDAALRDELAAAWGMPLHPGPLDHGALVPLLLLSAARPIVAAALPEWTGPGRGAPELDAALAAAEGFAAALRACSEGRVVVLIASAHGSAALSRRAPLLERPGASEHERRLLEALADPGALAAFGATGFAAAGTCGAGPLRALAAWAPEGVGEVLAHDAPVGVGYLVAAVRSP
jgi:hypothetical protein